jgi:hypothetical protein
LVVFGPPGVGNAVTLEIIMDDNLNNPNGQVGECPKRTFWLLPRPAAGVLFTI